MRKHDFFQLGLYVLASAVSVGAAFLFSLQFMGQSVAQEDQMAPPELEEQALPQDPDSSAGDEANSSETTSKSGGPGIAQLEGFLEPFIYDMINRRDPFLPYSDFIPVTDGPVRPTSPAQRFSLDELRLVAVMWDVKEPKAMFLDPKSEVLTLGRDESIGNRNGYIAAIREGEVVVVEAIRQRGDIIYRTRVLRIER